MPPRRRLHHRAPFLHALRRSAPGSRSPARRLSFRHRSAFLATPRETAKEFPPSPPRAVSSPSCAVRPRARARATLAPYEHALPRATPLHPNRTRAATRAPLRSRRARLPPAHGAAPAAPRACAPDNVLPPPSVCRDHIAPARTRSTRRSRVQRNARPVATPPVLAPAANEARHPHATVQIDSHPTAARLFAVPRLRR